MGHPEYLLAGIQCLLVMLLAGDRLVHRLIGKAPLEARVLTVETQVSKGNDRLSAKFSELQIHIGRIDVTLAEITTELRVLRGYRLDRTDG